MKIQFFCPRWGSEDVPYNQFFDKVKQAGYEGVEMPLPLDQKEREEILSHIQKNDLLLIGQHWECTLSGGDTYEADYEKYLRNLAEAKPIFINSQSGKDYFSIERNVNIIHIADQIADETGIPIVHETHRGKFSYAISVMLPYLDRLPELRLCADFSHWCAVSESLLEWPEQETILRTIMGRVDHVHARVGWQQGAQVSDPRAPEFEEALNRHLQWWDMIVEQNSLAGRKRMTFTPEFGPFPYMPSLPYVKQPLANQWATNSHMMHLLRERYSQ
jgi:hypothetical protein